MDFPARSPAHASSFPLTTDQQLCMLPAALCSVSSNSCSDGSGLLPLHAACFRPWISTSCLCPRGKVYLIYSGTRMQSQRKISSCQPTTCQVSSNMCYKGKTAGLQQPRHSKGIHSTACKSLTFLSYCNFSCLGTSPEANCFWKLSQSSIQPFEGVI